jgi:alpha-tubulin suppressor-like RCC1 family protein
VAVGLGHMVLLHEDGTVWTAGKHVLENNYNQCGLLGYERTEIMSRIKPKMIAQKSDGFLDAIKRRFGFGKKPPIEFVDSRATMEAFMKPDAPLKVPGLKNGIAIAAGDYHTVVLKKDGTVWTFGCGGLGYETTSDHNAVPKQVPGIAKIVAVAAGSDLTVALKKDGTVWTFGDKHPTPTQVKNLTNVIAIATTSRSNHHVSDTSNNSTLALKSDGTVWDLGDGFGISQKVPGLTNIKAIAIGDLHALVVKKDGTVLTYDPHQMAVSPVSWFTDMTVVAAGDRYSTYAIKRDGTLWTLHDDVIPDVVNERGQKMTDSTGVAAIAIKGRIAVILKNDGSVFSRGLEREIDHFGGCPDPMRAEICNRI